MKECIVFIEDGKNLAIFSSFQKFRKNSFHYILDFLVHHKKFNTKLEGGKQLKEKFKSFYGKEHTVLEIEGFNWDYKKFELNELENIYKIVEKLEEYNTNFTKINPKKGSSSFRSLNTNLAYLKLSPVYC